MTERRRSVQMQRSGRTVSDGRSRGTVSARSRGTASGIRNVQLRRIQGKKRSGESRDYYDYNLLAAVILLTCFGLVMLYSTSAYEASVNHSGNDFFYFTKQAAISAASFVMMLLFSQIDYHIFAYFSKQIYYISVALLIATKIIGRTINGARRWIYIGPISFQPAELAKLAIILFLPCVIIRLGNKLSTWKGFAEALGYGAVSSFCTYYFTDNLSTAIIIAGITVVLIFIVHPRTAPFLAAAGIGTVLIAIAVWVIAGMVSDSSGFRLKRIMVWLDPEAHASQGGYQVMQALYAIGSGGFFGKGLGNSAQKLGAVPEAQNDMIFSIICEELGVFGAALVILLFVFLLYRLFFIAQNAPDLLGSLIAAGIFVHIALQVIFNIAVVINLIPTTGITLPFISYGGTSILFLMAEMTLALSVSKRITFK